MNNIVQQHVIDPELCIRCNNCEEACPVHAITHQRNYVVDHTICFGCSVRACIDPCPTGAINLWRVLPADDAYPIAEQHRWDVLPEQDPALADRIVPVRRGETRTGAEGILIVSPRPPPSAALAETSLFTPARPASACLIENRRLTSIEEASDVRHLVLDFGQTNFPVLEGQSISVLPPGTDTEGRRYTPRTYSIASSRDGESPNSGTVALTVKRVIDEESGSGFRGVGSNYLCDAEIGDTISVAGPYGLSFLMPDDPASKLIMICTGTGIAPMRAMIQRRLRTQSKECGALSLVYGARTPHELPYKDELESLPTGFLNLYLAYSRVAGQPKRYVQDVLLEQVMTVSAWLADPSCYFYVCGLKGMEKGVFEAFELGASLIGESWDVFKNTLLMQGRFHVETY